MSDLYTSRQPSTAVNCSAACKVDTVAPLAHQHTECHHHYGQLSSRATMGHLGCRALGLEDQAQPSSSKDGQHAQQQPSGTGSTCSDVRQLAGSSTPARHAAQAQPPAATALTAAEATANGTDHARYDAHSNAADAEQHHHHLHANQVTSVSLRLSRPVHLQRCAFTSFGNPCTTQSVQGCSNVKSDVDSR